MHLLRNALSHAEGFAHVKVRVVGVGQPAAGDDGVGRRVVGALSAVSLPPGVALLEVSEPSALVEWMAEQAPIVVVDAVLGAPPGQVLELTPDELAQKPPLRISSHGLGVSEAIQLARTLHPVLAPVFIVAVTINPPARHQTGLTPEVNAAVPLAVARVLSLLENLHARNNPC